MYSSLYQLRASGGLSGTASSDLIEQTFDKPFHTELDTKFLHSNTRSLPGYVVFNCEHQASSDWSNLCQTLP